MVFGKINFENHHIKLYYFLVIWMLIGGCLMTFGEELKSGDLIFVPEEKGEFSKAIVDATASEDSVKFVHVGIIEVDSIGNAWVIEASPRDGVREISLQKFMEGTPNIIVKRLLIEYPTDKMLNRAKSFIGEGYDWWYIPDNGKMYCSELVYEAYLDAEGQHIFEAKPMNFRAPDGSMPEFWVRLFEELGEPIPEGEMGTNPQEMGKSSILETVKF